MSGVENGCQKLKVLNMRTSIWRAQLPILTDSSQMAAKNQIIWLSLSLSRVTDDSRWKNNEDVIFRLGSIETQILLILHYSLMLPRRPSNNGNDDYISNVITAEAVTWKILASGASIAARKCKWGSVPIIDGADKWNINATCAKHVCYGIYDISSLRLVVMMSTRQFIDSGPF